MTVVLRRSMICSIHWIVVWQVGVKDSGALKSDSENQGKFSMCALLLQLFCMEL